MPLPAGAFSRKVAFLVRAPVPSTAEALRAGFVAYGDPVWAALKDGRPREMAVAGFTLQAKGATLTIRDSAWARTLTNSHRVLVGGEEFEITGAVRPDQPNGEIRLELVSAPTRAMYDREFEQRGEVVTIRRTNRDGTAVSMNARAVVIGYEPDELVGGITQGERRVVLSASDVEAAAGPAGFALPFQSGGTDLLRVRGRSLSITEIDDSTHRSAGTLNAYLLRVKG